VSATVADTALAYACIAGPDKRDPNSLGQPNPSLEGLHNPDLRGIRIGVFADWFEHADDEVVARCREAVEHLRAAGAQIVDISIPELGLTQTVHLITIVTEMAGAHILHYAQNRRRYGYDTRANLALGRTLTGWDYVHAQRHRQRLTAHFARAFQEVDLIATPSTATTAPLIPDSALKTGLSDLALTAKIMRYAQPGNVMGIPALTVPAGYDQAGLPIGFQLMAAPWSEHLALRAGAVVEAAVPRRRPKVWRALLK